MIFRSLKWYTCLFYLLGNNIACAIEISCSHVHFRCHLKAAAIGYGARRPMYPAKMLYLGKVKQPRYAIPVSQQNTVGNLLSCDSINAIKQPWLRRVYRSITPLKMVISGMVYYWFNHIDDEMAWYDPVVWDKLCQTKVIGDRLFSTNWAVHPKKSTWLIWSSLVSDVKVLPHGKLQGMPR